MSDAVLDLDAGQQAYKGNPYRIYAELRRTAPVRRISLNGRSGQELAIDQDKIIWQAKPHLRGPTELPMRFTPPAGGPSPAG